MLQQWSGEWLTRGASRIRAIELRLRLVNASAAGRWRGVAEAISPKQNCTPISPSRNLA